MKGPDTAWEVRARGVGGQENIHGRRRWERCRRRRGQAIEVKREKSGAEEAGWCGGP